MFVLSTLVLLSSHFRHLVVSTWNDLPTSLSYVLVLLKSKQRSYQISSIIIANTYICLLYGSKALCSLHALTFINSLKTIYDRWYYQNEWENCGIENLRVTCVEWQLWKQTQGLCSQIVFFTAVDTASLQKSSLKQITYLLSILLEIFKFAMYIRICILSLQLNYGFHKGRKYHGCFLGFDYPGSNHFSSGTSTQIFLQGNTISHFLFIHFHP